MNRCLTLAAGMALCVTSLVATAKALPPIMDRVPAGAPVVIVIPSIEGLEKDINSMLQLAGAPPMANADMLMGQIGLTGISKKGSLALVMLAPPNLETGEEPEMVAIFQADDYSAVTKSLKAEKDGELDKATIDGKDVWFKSVGGGFVVAGAEKDDVTKFDGKTGGTDTHKKFFGSRADKLTDKADFAVFVNVAKLKPLIDQGSESMEQMLADAGSIEGQNPVEQIKWMKEHIVGDLDGGVFALSIDASGVSFDMTGVAREGTGLAKAFDTAGKANALLGKIPGGSYLAAYAVDMSNKHWNDFFKTMPQGNNPVDPKTLFGDGAKALEDATGMAVVVGVPSGGLANGLLSRITGYIRTATPEKLVALARDEVPKALEKDELGKLVYKTGVTEVEGIKVDSYELTVPPNEDVPQMAMAMAGMFGASGAPSGYVAVVDGGLVATTSKNSELMGTAIKAAKGEATLSADKTIAAVHEKLPAGCFTEGYVNVREIMDMLLKLGPTFGGPTLDVKLPAQLPPIAGGYASGDRQVQATFYIPAEVIKTGGDVYKAAMASQAGEEEGGDEKKGDEKTPKDEKGTNPKF